MHNFSQSASKKFPEASMLQSFCRACKILDAFSKILFKKYVTSKIFRILHAALTSVVSKASNDFKNFLSHLSIIRNYEALVEISHWKFRIFGQRCLDNLRSSLTNYVIF